MDYFFQAKACNIQKAHLIDQHRDKGEVKIKKIIL